MWHVWQCDWYVWLLLLHIRSILVWSVLMLWQRNIKIPIYIQAPTCSQHHVPSLFCMTHQILCWCLLCIIMFSSLLSRWSVSSFSCSEAWSISTTTSSYTGQCQSFTGSPTTCSLLFLHSHFLLHKCCADQTWRLISDPRIISLKQNV